MAMKAMSTPIGSMMMATSALRACMQKDDAHQRHDDAFLDEDFVSGCDGAVDQLGTIVDGLNRYAFRQAGFDISSILLLTLSNDIKRVLAVARHGNAGDHLALAIELGDAAPFVRGQFDAGNIPHQHRHAALAP